MSTICSTGCYKTTGNPGRGGSTDRPAPDRAPIPRASEAHLSPALTNVRCCERGEKLSSNFVPVTWPEPGSIAAEMVVSGAAEMVRDRIEDEKSNESIANVLEKARRRGRWTDIKSLQVYTKTHLLVRMIEKTERESLRKETYISDRPEVLGSIWEEEFERVKSRTESGVIPADPGRGSALNPPEEYKLPQKYARLEEMEGGKLSEPGSMRDEKEKKQDAT